MTVAIGSSQKSLNNLFSFSSLATTLSTSILGASPSSSSSNSSSTISTLTNYSPSPSLSSSSSTVTLTRFNHRRSSFDYGNDDDNIDNTGFKVCII